jgi:hypothetical protein
MKFKLWREHGALNSPPIFAAVEQGLKKIGMTIVDGDQDIDVIWSVLWQGRMMPNKIIYEKAKSLNRPIMIIEVGNLLRGKTWRISLDHIHGSGIFANTDNLDSSRPKKLGMTLKNVKNPRKDSILIACQHANSLQWEGQPTMGHWVYKTIEEVRQYSDRPILVRPHPRSPFSIKLPGVEVITPAKVPNTYDDFNISYDHHCVINYNSGPAVKAAIEGTPVICDQTSLAWPVSDKIENLDKISLPDREDWFLKLCHTEWTVPELQNGEPFSRLFLK